MRLLLFLSAKTIPLKRILLSLTNTSTVLQCTVHP